MLRGKVPFPAHIVTQFPPWESVLGMDLHPPRHAEIGDVVTMLYPWKAFTHRAIAGGTLPLWNPFLLQGTPFQADPYTAFFYPPNLVYYFLPTPLAWCLSFFVRTVLAGLFATLLAKALGATRTAALTAGVIFAFCGWVTVFQAYPHLDTALWLPLVLLSVDRLQRRPEGSSVALTGLAFALPVLAGQPEIAAHVTVVGLLFFLYRLGLPSLRQGAVPARRLRFLVLFGAAGLLALGLAAVQMLPTLEWIGQLERNLHMFWGFRPLHEIGAFLSRDLGANPNSANIPIPESAAYAGMLTLLVAPLAIFHRNRRDAIFFAALVACALQIVFGKGPAYWLSQHTPILSSIPNWRFLVVADLGLAVLAGLGISALERELEAGRRLRARWWLLPAAALGVGGIGVAIIIARAKGTDAVGLFPLSTLSLQHLVQRVRGPQSSAAMLLGAAILLGLALAGRIPRGRFAAIALAFVAADLVTASYRYLPFASPGEIFPPAPTFQFLKRDPTPHRVASVDMTYGSNFELMYGLESAAGYTIPLRRAKRLLSTLGPKTDAPTLKAEMVVASPNRVLDLMNVKYLVATTWNRSAEVMASRPDRFRLVFSDASVRIFENLSVLPRAFLVPASRAVTLADEDSQLAQLCAPGFDPARAVILPEGLPAPDGGDGGGGDRPAVSGVSGIEGRINGVSLRVTAAERSVLVLSQMHYPGWKAFIDGKEAPVLRVDYAFVGATLEPGTHAVRFVYSPRSFRIGAFLSGAAFLTCLALYGFRRGPRRAKQETP